MVERFKQARLSAGLTQAEFGELIGKNRGQIRDIEIGKVKVSPQIALILEKKLNISHNWLLFGEGSMYVSNADAPNVKPPRNRDNDLVNVLDFDEVKAAAGSGITNFSEALPAIVCISRKVLASLNVDIEDHMQTIEVEGASMLPTLTPGEKIYLNPMQYEHRFKDGGIYVAEYWGDLLVKRVQRNPKSGAVRLISDNKDFKPIDIEGDDLDNLRIIGRVLLKEKLSRVE
jgi:phage repressor protein C with HTH and peptisase S24 domain